MTWVSRWRNRTPRITAARFERIFRQTVSPTILLDGFELWYAGNDMLALRLTCMQRSAVRFYAVKDGCPHCVLLCCFDQAAETFGWPDARRAMLRADYEFKLEMGVQLGIGSTRPSEEQLYVPDGWPCIVLVRDAQLDTVRACDHHRR